MQVELNSVWQFNSVDTFVDGLYRVLAIYPDEKQLVVFLLSETKHLLKPQIIDYEIFIELIKRKCISADKYELPFYINFSDDAPDKHILIRDEQFRLIEGLIENPDYLLDIAENQRCKTLANHARSKKTYVQKLYRILNTFWRFGQERDALLPAYKLSGGVGQSRKETDIKRGRPIEFNTLAFKGPEGVNTTDYDKKIFVKAMKNFGLKGEKTKFSTVYDEMLDEYYSKETTLAELENREPNVPSYRSFVYWIKKLLPEHEKIKKQTNQGDFDRNSRGLNGRATDHAKLVGSYFEIDATVLDVHVVTEFNRRKVLGRPTFYCVVDKQSRMIVGMHVSMEYASWRAGRQALVNSFSPKKEYCARFGVEISEEEWPCHHIPQRLLCDRGEFVCQNAEKLAVPLIGHLSIAAPYRADLKGVVERRFKILNDRLIHKLMGTTKGRHYIRGDKDPRLDAALTLTEVSQLLINEVINHNHSIYKDLARQSPLLIENDLDLTPINFWNIHLQNARHALSEVSEAKVRARLLPTEFVSMTSNGIRLNDQMYYDSDHLEFENYKVVARKKNWKLKAKIDQDNSSFIHVQFNEREDYVKCNLKKMSKVFLDRHSADIFYYADFFKSQSNKISRNKRTAANHNQSKNILENAKKELKQTAPLSSKKAGIKDMKERRRQHILDNRYTPEKNIEAIEEVVEHRNKLVDERNSNVISMMKRKKVNEN